MRIQVLCEHCDFPADVDELRIYEGNSTCSDCFVWVSNWGEGDDPLEDPEVLWSALPHLPPILAMEPGPPPIDAPSDTQWLVTWDNQERGWWSEVIPGWRLKNVPREDERSGRPYVLYHVQLPGGQDE